jgi:hypothetical protein
MDENIEMKIIHKITIYIDILFNSKDYNNRNKYHGY